MAPYSDRRPVDEETAAGPPIALAMVVVLVAAAAAAATTTVGVEHTEASARYSGHPEFVAWATLVIGLIGVSMAGGVYAWPAWRELNARSTRPARLTSYGMSAVVVLGYDASPELVSREFLDLSAPPLYLNPLREVGIILLVGVPTLPAVSGLVLAALLLTRRKLPWDGAGGRVAISELLWIRAQLHLFLTMLALVIGGNVLTVGAMRGVMLADGLPGTEAPVVILLLYGATMTGLLALVYIPAYLAWQSRARELRDELFPLPPDGRADHDWYIGRADLEGLLNLKVSAGSAFIAGLGLLAPFAGSLVSAIIPGIGPSS